MQKASFLRRFGLLTLGLYLGAVLCVFVLTIVKIVCFFPYHFWHWLYYWSRYDVLPVALAELLRSPVMGLLFALLGARHLTPRGIFRFGAVCGMLAYATAHFISLLASTGRPYSTIIQDWGLIQAATLGLPVVLILLSRFLDWKNPPPGKKS